MSTRGPEPAISNDELIELINAADDPFVSSTEIAEAVGIARQTAYKHLQRMHENGGLRKKKVGGSAVIWWLPKPTEIR